MLIMHGSNASLHICSSDFKGRPRLVSVYTIPAQYARLLQFAHNLAKALIAMAILQVLGITGQRRSSREYGKMYERQLFSFGILARMASKFQSLDRQVHLYTAWR